MSLIEDSGDWAVSDAEHAKRCDAFAQEHGIHEGDHQDIKGIGLCIWMRLHGWVPAGLVDAYKRKDSMNDLDMQQLVDNANKGSGRYTEARTDSYSPSASERSDADDARERMKARNARLANMSAGEAQAEMERLAHEQFQPEGTVFDGYRNVTYSGNKK